MKKFFGIFGRPAPLWALSLTWAAMLAGIGVAAAPWTYGQIVSSAAITPSPAPTGYYGPAVIAQATAAPTAQTGYINLNGGATFGQVTDSGATASTLASFSSGKVLGSTTASTFGLAPVYNSTGTLQTASTLHVSIMTAGTGTSVTCTVGNVCFTHTFTLSGAAAFSGVPYCSASGDYDDGIGGLAGFTANAQASTGTTIYADVSNVAASPVASQPYMVYVICVGT